MSNGFRSGHRLASPIIACEPSCILTIKDDYPALLRGELRQKAEVVAAACQTFEEFLNRLWRAGSVSSRRNATAAETMPHSGR